MRIQQITLNNYRNFDYLNIKFGKFPLIIISGENAQGKTNLLESIYVSSFTKSFRTNRTKDLIMFDKDYSKININIEKNDINNNLTYIFTKKSEKKFLFNNEKYQLKKVLGKIKVVKFSPEDIGIIKGSPTNRKKFFNGYISQIDKNYLYYLINYSKLFRQKNKLLKNKNINFLLIEIYNKQLSNYISKITKIRKKFVDRLNIIFKEKFKLISKYNLNIDIKYKSIFNNLNEEEIFNKINRKINQEFKNKNSFFYIQNDDFIFEINNISANIFASQGQRRCIILSLILSIVEYIKIYLNENCIILLDDVLSELDYNIKIKFINLLKNNQIFITTTDFNIIKDKINVPYENIIIKEGKIYNERKL